MPKPIFSAKILTIFPEMFPGPLQYSLAGQALSKDIWSLEIINIRDFGLTRHHTVDDEPFGGGNGMVMRADVLGAALDHALCISQETIEKSGERSECIKIPEDARSLKFDTTNRKISKIYYMSPRGKTLTQSLAKEISAQENIIIICGRFEGIDERVIDEYNIDEISIGDYVLSGGEIAAMTLLDACVRLLPGVLANQDTLTEESFNYFEQVGTLLEYPQYTRPASWRGREVPEILRGGNHRLIEQWRKDEALKITQERRPELLQSQNIVFGEKK